MGLKFHTCCLEKVMIFNIIWSLQTLRLRQKHVMDVLDHLLSEEVKHKASEKTENMSNWSGFPRASEARRTSSLSGEVKHIFFCVRIHGIS